MLYFFVGDDVARAKADALRKSEGRAVVRFGEGAEPFENIGGYLEQQGMFQPALALILDRPLDDDTGRAWLFDRNDVLESASALVFAIQPELKALEQKKLPKNAQIVSYTVSEGKSVFAQPEHTAFQLVDALQAGDRKRAWIVYRSLIEAGVSPEEIHGALAWAARGVVLASKTATATEAGMKDYPYRKARATALKVGAAAAEQGAAELVRMYHRARAGGGDLERLLEIHILKKD